MFDVADPSTPIEGFEIPPEREEVSLLFRNHTLPSELDSLQEIVFEGTAEGFEALASWHLRIVPWVTSTASEGPGSLRDVVESASLLAESPRVGFAPWVFSETEAPHLIRLETPIQLIDTVVIDGPEAEGTPLVEILPGAGGGRLFEIGVAGGPAGIEVTLRGLTIRDGAAPEGGCILSHARLFLLRVHLRSCAATGSGGAILGTSGSLIRVDDSIFRENVAGSSGGAIHGNQDAHFWILGSSFEANQATHEGGAISVEPGASLTIEGAIFRRNTVTGPEGRGGAVHVKHPSAPTTHQHFARAFFTQNRAALGGALHATGTISIRESALVYNIADQGGAIAFEGSDDNYVLNTTVYGNQALFAAGIFMHDAGAQISYSTITGNEAAYDPDVFRSGEIGGLHLFDGGSLEMLATILADNVAEGGFAPDLFVDGSTFVSSGHNLIGDIHASGALGALVFTDLRGDSSADGPLDPRLGIVPADDAGFVLPPLPTSPALNAIHPGQCTGPVGALENDQRRVSRPQGLGCDIGAVEVEVD